MITEQLTTTLTDILDDLGATDVTVLDLRGKTVIADCFVLATGRSSVNVRAIADGLEDKMEKAFSTPVVKREGRDAANWIVLDYGSVIVHVFSAETRQKYSLEMLWSGDAQN